MTHSAYQNRMRSDSTAPPRGSEFGTKHNVDNPYSEDHPASVQQASVTVYIAEDTLSPKDAC